MTQQRRAAPGQASVREKLIEARRAAVQVKAPGGFQVIADAVVRRLDEAIALLPAQPEPQGWQPQTCATCRHDYYDGPTNVCAKGCVVPRRDRQTFGCSLHEAKP